MGNQGKKGGKEWKKKRKGVGREKKAKERRKEGTKVKRKEEKWWMCYQRGEVDGERRISIFTIDYRSHEHDLTTKKQL